MKIVLSSRRHHYVARVGIFLVTVALIAGMVGCGGDGYTPPSQNLEIRTWYDLDAIRDNLSGNHALMNDLDSATAGYDELASPTANEGKGWESIGIRYTSAFSGSFDGQGYEIRDLFMNRPDDSGAAVFGFVGEGGVIQNVGVVNATLTDDWQVGGLVGDNRGTISNSHASGSMTGERYIGGLVGLNRESGTVTNSYSSSNVTGNMYVDGLVGGNEGTVNNSYSTGNVSGTSFVGGLVGLNDEGTVSNSFWDTQTSGQATSDGGTGKNTTEMQDIATFSGATWDIVAVGGPGERNPAYIWNIVDDVTYPFLSWQPVS